jgi:serine phosphatase RsbU (regulator of sigma subunit)
MVSHRVIDHITDGVRDSAAIRAASNNIFLEHNGSVRANLDVLTVDFQTNTILISRNSPVPVFLVNEDLVDCLSSDSEPIGSRVDISPSIVELPIQAGMKVVVFSDGVFNAGRNNQQSSDFCTTIQALIEEQEPSAQEIADFLLNQAIRLDDGRPKDDMSVIVLMLRAQSNDRIRRMSVSMAMGES